MANDSGSKILENTHAPPPLNILALDSICGPSTVQEQILLVWYRNKHFE